jgi:hypothetical protein
MVLHGGGGSLYSRQRRWTTAAWQWESVGGETAAPMPWVWQGSGSRCLRAVGTVRMWSAHGSDRVADGGPHAVLIFFNLTKTGSNLLFGKECLTLLQKFLNFACH